MMNITEESNQNLNNSSNNIFTGLQWNQGPPHYSPWGHSPNSPPASVVTFNAQSTQMDQQSEQNIVNYNQLIGTRNNFGHNISVGECNQASTSSNTYGDKPLLHCKRKANVDFSVPNKQHITEEKMAQHMSRLHISSETTHLEDISDVEDTTTRQKRLYVCEEMRRLQTENILPTALLGRLERPCMAVMLWQPPAKIPELICQPQMQQNLTNSNVSVCSAVAQAGAVFQRPRNPQNTHNILEEDENDNSSGTLNLNNMEMDS